MNRKEWTEALRRRLFRIVIHADHQATTASNSRQSFYWQGYHDGVATAISHVLDLKGSFESAIERHIQEVD